MFYKTLTTCTNLKPKSQTIVPQAIKPLHALARISGTETFDIMHLYFLDLNLFHYGFVKMPLRPCFLGHVALVVNEGFVECSADFYLLCND